MNCAEIIRKYLEDNGFDGLCNVDGECGCELSDLQMCEEDFSGCEPGYKVILEIGDAFYGEAEYFISPTKE